MTDLRTAELRIIAAILKHKEEGGAVPVLRLGERPDVYAEYAKANGITREQAKARLFGVWYGVTGKDVFK